MARTELIPRQVLFGNPEKTSPSLSPDGTRLAFLAPVNGVLNVWVGPSDDPAAARPVTDERGRGIHGYFWAFTNDRTGCRSTRRRKHSWRSIWAGRPSR